MPNSATPIQFARLSRGYWFQTTSLKAWGLTLGVVATLIINLLIAYGLNRWNRWFFDALEVRSKETLWRAVLTFPTLIILGAACAVFMTFIKMRLQLDWRKWLTEKLLKRWLSEQRYYKLNLSENASSVPEARIAEDVRLATEPVIDLGAGFVNATLSAVTFIGVLYTVGGSLEINGLSIPGYLALASVVYAIAVSLATYFIGRPLSMAVNNRNESEALFRSSLQRVRENVESIALIRGDQDELRRAQENFSTIGQRTLELARHHCNLTWILNANSFFAGTFALLLCLPKYLDDQMTLGAMMQIGAAFTAVLSALNWFTENYIPVAQWNGSAIRVTQLNTDFEAIDFDRKCTPGIRRVFQNEKGIRLKNLSLHQRGGRILLKNAEVSIAPGEKILITGASGCGKSTLIRAIAGLWPWGRGEVFLPGDSEIGFVPQKPYIPPGNLKEIIAYPLSTEEYSRSQYESLLNNVGLSYFCDQIESDFNWEQTLSGGERQRIAFARLFIHKPEIIVMDEATSALDGDSEQRLMTELIERCPESTILSVGHRTGLERFHTRKLEIVGETFFQKPPNTETARKRAASFLRTKILGSRKPFRDPESLGAFESP